MGKEKGDHISGMYSIGSTIRASINEPFRLNSSSGIGMAGLNGFISGRDTIENYDKVIVSIKGCMTCKCTDNESTFGSNRKAFPRFYH